MPDRRRLKKQKLKHSRREGNREPMPGGKECPTCSMPMQRFKHTDRWKPGKTQPYFYWYWDICKPCGRVQHYEDAKRWVSEMVAADNPLVKRIATLEAVLKFYEQWEADLILCSEAWANGLPRMTQELYDRWMEIQTKRNAALASTTDALQSRDRKS